MFSVSNGLPSFLATHIPSEFAHVLELLETEFYMAAIQKYQAQDFLDAGYVNADVIAQQVQYVGSLH